MDDCRERGGSERVTKEAIEVELMSASCLAACIY
jgi:hypothetical protein